MGKGETGEGGSHRQEWRTLSGRSPCHQSGTRCIGAPGTLGWETPSNSDYPTKCDTSGSDPRTSLVSLDKSLLGKHNEGLASQHELELTATQKKESKEFFLDPYLSFLYGAQHENHHK